jgi:hypothetical protein
MALATKHLDMVIGVDTPEALRIRAKGSALLPLGQRLSCATWSGMILVNTLK